MTLAVFLVLDRQPAAALLGPSQSSRRHAQEAALNPANGNWFVMVGLFVAIHAKQSQRQSRLTDI
jgi:hypothetical protein